jgi:DNA-binding transcriptional LysR family regulator
VPAAEVGAALESREVDLAIGIFEPFQRGIIEETLFHERYVAITARSRRGAGSGALTAGALSAASLVFASPTATYHEGVQRMVEELGLAGRALVHTRHYAALPELVTTTDLLAIVPLLFARSLLARWPIRVHELPGKAIEYDVRMIWHETATNDPAHGWLRALVRRLFSQSSNGKPT